MEMNEDEKMASFMAIHYFLQDGINYSHYGGNIECDVSVEPGGQYYERTILFKSSGDAVAGIEDYILKGYGFNEYVYSNKHRFFWDEKKRVLQLSNKVFQITFKRKK